MKKIKHITSIGESLGIENRILLGESIEYDFGDSIIKNIENYAEWYESFQPVHTDFERVCIMNGTAVNLSRFLSGQWAQHTISPAQSNVVRSVKCSLSLMR